MAYDDLIAAAETSYGIPKGLYARLLSRGERSGPTAVSPKGNYGPAQLGAAAAQDVGVDRFDLTQNIQGGAKYFAELLKRYNGDAAKAIAAYNEGPGRVDRGIVYPETKAYLGRVMGMDGAASADIVGQVLPQYMPDPKRIAGLQKQADTAAQQALDASGRQAKEAEAAKAEIDRIQKQYLSGQTPDAPKAPELPDAPKTEPHDPIQALGQFLPLLAAFGGALNKKYAMSALAASTGAMKAQQTNDEDAMKRAHDHWLDTMQKTMEAYKAQQSEYEAALKKLSSNREIGMAQIEALNAKYGMTAAQTAVANGNLQILYSVVGAAFEPLKQLEPIARQAQEDKYRQEDLALRREGADTRGWEIQTDPATNTTVRINKATGEIRDLEGNPYQPKGGLQKQAGVVRSPVGMALQRYTAEHPDATDEDISKEYAHIQAQAKATRDFYTGKQGQAINSFNVALNHLDTLQELGKALDNGDVQEINKWKQAFAAEFGSPAPVAFDAAKRIVGDELTKAVTGSAGALGDRESADRTLSRASTWPQLLRVIETYKGLMSGQLKGLKQQYEQTTGLKDFDERLSPAARQQLTSGQTSAGTKTSPYPMPKSAKDAEKDKWYQTPKGVLRWTGDHFSEE